MTPPAATAAKHVIVTPTQTSLPPPPEKDAKVEVVPRPLAPVPTAVRVLPYEAMRAAFAGQVARNQGGKVDASAFKTLTAALQPGDIVLEHGDGALIPNTLSHGYWTHARLYLGSPSALRAFDDLPEAKAWVAAKGFAGVTTFSEYIALAYPRASLIMQSSGDDKPVTIEAYRAKRKVVIREWEGPGSDALAAFRPAATVSERLDAIAYALGRLNTPYDSGDTLPVPSIATDDKLFCAELVIKSYHKLSWTPDSLFGTPTFFPSTFADIAEGHWAGPSISFVGLATASPDTPTGAAAEARLRTIDDDQWW
jgi:hypothetical protein